MNNRDVFEAGEPGARCCARDCVDPSHRASGLAGNIGVRCSSSLARNARCANAASVFSATEHHRARAAVLSVRCASGRNRLPNAYIAGSALPAARMVRGMIGRTLNDPVEDLGVKHRAKAALRELTAQGPAATRALQRGLSHENPAVRVGCCVVLDHRSTASPARIFSPTLRTTTLAFVDGRCMPSRAIAANKGIVDRVRTTASRSPSRGCPTMVTIRFGLRQSRSSALQFTGATTSLPHCTARMRRIRTHPYARSRAGTCPEVRSIEGRNPAHRVAPRAGARIEACDGPPKPGPRRISDGRHIGQRIHRVRTSATPTTGSSGRAGLSGLRGNWTRLSERRLRARCARTSAARDWNRSRPCRRRARAMDLRACRAAPVRSRT
jgi:hypothetical protein